MWKFFECLERSVVDCLEKNKKFFKTEVELKRKIEETKNKNQKLT